MFLLPKSSTLISCETSSPISKSGSIYLDREMYKIVVEYFERGGQESLEVNWKGPGFEWQAIPSYILFHKNN